MSFCTYCGAPADTVDHVVPVACYGVTRKQGLQLIAKGSPKVDCCRDCNTTLGAADAHTVEGRAALLLDAIRRRYRSLFELKSFTREELAQLGPALRRVIERAWVERKEVERRLRHLAWVARKKAPKLPKPGKRILPAPAVRRCACGCDQPIKGGPGTVFATKECGRYFSKRRQEMGLKFYDLALRWRRFGNDKDWRELCDLLDSEVAENRLRQADIARPVADLTAAMTGRV